MLYKYLLTEKFTVSTINADLISFLTLDYVKATAVIGWIYTQHLFWIGLDWIGQLHSSAINVLVLHECF